MVIDITTYTKDNRQMVKNVWARLADYQKNQIINITANAINKIGIKEEPVIKIFKMWCREHHTRHKLYTSLKKTPWNHNHNDNDQPSLIRVVDIQWQLSFIHSVLSWLQVINSIKFINLEQLIICYQSRRIHNFFNFDETVFVAINGFRNGWQSIVVILNANDWQTSDGMLAN